MAWAAAHDGPHASRRRLRRAARRPALPPRLRSRRATAGGRAPLPRGANHVGVAVARRTGSMPSAASSSRTASRIDECFAFDRGRALAAASRRCPRPAARSPASRSSGVLHVIGGAIGDTFETSRSIDWHLVYDPRADRWSERAPMPTGRDHAGIVAVDGAIHVIGGRVDTFHTNSQPAPRLRPARRTAGRRARRSRPRARATASVFYRGRVFVHGRRRHATASMARTRPTIRRPTAGRRTRRC